VSLFKFFTKGGVSFLDNRTDDLWQGGPWEQPAPSFPPPPAVTIPSYAMRERRPVLRARRRRRMWPAVAGILGILLSLFLLTGLFYLLTDLDFSLSSNGSPGQPAQTQEYSTQPPTIPQAETGTGVVLTLTPDSGQTLSYTQIYEKNLPSIVSIEAQSQNEYSTGTGVVLTQDGYIVTNAHVIAGADAVRVAFYDNQVLPASLVGFNSDEDLAVLKVEATNLIPAEFGDSSTLRCGDPVAAIGDPLGYRSTITDGIISALDREVEVDGITMVLIQTSAAINFGNSGGALINQYGQVVGITTIKIVTDDGSAEALGFAIPSTRVKYVVDALIDGQEIRTGVFGFTVLTQPIPGGGLLLDSVDPNSDAYAKGLQAGDIILSANGQTITSAQDLARLKLPLGPGDVVTLTYLRDGQTYTVDVTLIDADQVSQEG
jgi:serine protease Do